MQIIIFVSSGLFVYWVTRTMQLLQDTGHESLLSRTRLGVVFCVRSCHAPLKVIAGHVSRRARLAWTDWQSVRRLPTCPT